MARRRPRDDDDDYEDVDDRYEDDDDDDDRPRKPKAKSNAWTGLLAISLVAFVAATVLMYLDADAHTGTIPDPGSVVQLPELNAAATTPGR